VLSCKIELKKYWTPLGAVCSCQAASICWMVGVGPVVVLVFVAVVSGVALVAGVVAGVAANVDDDVGRVELCAVEAVDAATVDPFAIVGYCGMALTEFGNWLMLAAGGGYGGKAIREDWTDIC
jgi:hypothetical protein